MELKDLVGEHILDAVDFQNDQVKDWGDHFIDCQVMRFRLGGVVYSVVENPDDGYRSSMREIVISDNAVMKNVFPPGRVVGRYYGDTDDKLELIDVKTGGTVLEAGTDNSDDYYPSFVASFHPEAMATNTP